jgi:hypothetical protein
LRVTRLPGLAQGREVDDHMPGVLLALVAASRNSRGQDKQDRKPARRRPAKAQETAFRWVAFALAIVAGFVEAQWP